MGDNNFRELFKEFILRKIPSAKPASGGTVLNCRCMECGDSTDPHSRHMYIFPPGRGKPIWYYCHKCNASALFDHKKMIQWNIYEADMAQMVNDYNERILKNGRYANYNPKVRYFLMNDYITMDNTTDSKINYINNRLGLQLTPQDFLDLKIVLNLKDLLQRNQITKFTRNVNIVNDLDRAFVGFLSIDNAFVCLRKIGDDIVYKDINRRYIDYRISFKEDTSQKFYTIPTEVNLLSTDMNRLPIHIAEGAFDILSIYMNLRNRAEGIYTSVSGSNYISVLYHFLMMVKTPNVEVHIYPDNDKGGAQWKMKRIREWINEMFPLYIHRNMAPKEKDFGVSIDRIDERITPFNHLAEMELFNKMTDRRIING